MDARQHADVEEIANRHGNLTHRHTFHSQSALGRVDVAQYHHGLEISFPDLDDEAVIVVDLYYLSETYRQATLAEDPRYVAWLVDPVAGEDPRFQIAWQPGKRMTVCEDD